MVTPVVSKTRKSQTEFNYFVNRFKEVNPTIGCTVCIDFVVESAVKLQEFDFDVEKKAHETRKGKI